MTPRELRENIEAKIRKMRYSNYIASQERETDKRKYWEAVFKDKEIDEKEPTWQTADGEIIYVRDMTDRHLENSIHFIAKISKAANNLARNVSGRNLAFYSNPKIKHLLAEAKKRGLPIADNPLDDKIKRKTKRKKKEPELSIDFPGNRVLSF